MYIAKVKYKMFKNDEWKLGYVIGEREDEEVTLLDEEYKYVPKVTIDDKEFLAYDIIKDVKNPLTISIPH